MRRALPMSQQLALGVGLRDDATFETFRPGPNEIAVAMIRSLASGGAEQQVFLWGPAGSGRSHLLQAACQHASQGGRRITYLPLSELARLDSALLEGLEALDLVAVDDVDAVAGQRPWEHGLFDLINRLRAGRTRLAVTAGSPPAAVGFSLPDLTSRLGWGPVFQLHALAEPDRRAVLEEAAERRGLSLSSDAVGFLMTRCRRDLASLLATLDRLDQASLAAQRRLTIPFIREVLEQGSVPREPS
jgi:DnaA family protein